VSAVAVSADAVYALRLADDCFVLSHRLAEWSSRAPSLEEDVALTNIGLDLLGQARHLYARVAELDGTARSEDDYVYLRDERDYVNCLLVEQENGDFAVTIARQLLVSAYQLELWKALRESSDEHLAAVATKALTETTYHLDHATQWTLRLGDGTAESHQRIQTALDTLWPFTAELFEQDEVVAELVDRGVAADPSRLLEAWSRYVDGVLREATLQRPDSTWAPSGGRHGMHTERFGYMLAEMQHLHRSYPGARW
jgi:ring-1,2-phenylacetyl-CoA epoxidase subunit PaaC